MHAVYQISCCHPSVPSSPPRSPSRGSPAWCCQWVQLRRLAMLLIGALLVFFAQQMWLWEVWTCPECVGNHICTEVVYEFDRPSWFQSIYNDADLKSQCGVHPTTDNADTSWRPIYTAFASSKHTPDIITKCGTVTPVPLNPGVNPQHEQQTAASYKNKRKRTTRDTHNKTPLDNYENISRDDTQKLSKAPSHDTAADGISHDSKTNKIPPLTATEAKSEQLVPQIVHYVWFGYREFTFLNYISVLSAHKFASPRFIYIHGDNVPYGHWWNRTLQEVPSIYFVPRERTLRVQGYKLPWIEHSSDLLRLQTIYDNGGIYLDTDIILINSFSPLLYYETVLGRETNYGLGSGIIIARPKAPFICMWRQGYRTYMPWPWNWANYAVWTPNKLAKAIPGHIHIEEDTLHHPNWQKPELLYEAHYDWSRNYAMHIWKRLGHVPDSVEEMDMTDNTLGEIMRRVYYGDSKLRT